MSDASDRHLYLTDVSQRDKPWDEHRDEALRVQSFYSQVGYDRYAERISDCSLRLVFALEATTEEEFNFRLKSARFCRVRLCPVCQWRRSLMWRARFFEAVPKLIHDYPKARYIFLTLTVRNCEISELRATLQHMTKAWDRLSKRKAFPAIGWVRSVEVTRNGVTGEAHPHFHVLMMVKTTYFKSGEYVNQQSWRELWQDCLRVDYLPVVNVKSVRSQPSKVPDPGEGQPIDESHPLLYGILETLKYSVKFKDLAADPQWLAELTQQLHKTRAVVIGGVLRDYLRAEEPENLISEDEEIEPQDAPLIYFDWMQNVRRYAKVDPSSRDN